MNELQFVSLLRSKRSELGEEIVLMSVQRERQSEGLQLLDGPPSSVQDPLSPLQGVQRPGPPPFHFL